MRLNNLTSLFPKSFIIYKLIFSHCTHKNIIFFREKLMFCDLPAQLVYGSIPAE